MAKAKTKAKTGGGRKKATTTASATKKLGGKKFTKVSCHSTKTDAKKAAEKARASGKLARVVKSGSANCVYTRTAGR